MACGIDEAAAGRAADRWDSIAKPLKGLGRLEELVIQIAGITGDENVRIGKRAVIVMCADNGIVEEGVTQTDSEVTAVVSLNIAKGTASINRMSDRAGIDVIPVDIGTVSYTHLDVYKRQGYGRLGMSSDESSMIYI